MEYYHVFEDESFYDRLDWVSVDTMTIVAFLDDIRSLHYGVNLLCVF